MISVTEQIKDRQFNARMNYFNSLQTVYDYDSVWSMYEIEDINDTVPFENQVGRRIAYQYIRDDATCEEIYNDLENNTKSSFAEVSTTCCGDTWQDMWRAAEQLIKLSGTHHRYIEDFEMLADGSWLLITGS